MRNTLEDFDIKAAPEEAIVSIVDRLTLSVFGTHSLSAPDRRGTLILTNLRVIALSGPSSKPHHYCFFLIHRFTSYMETKPFQTGGLLSYVVEYKAEMGFLDESKIIIETGLNVQKSSVEDYIEAAKPISNLLFEAFCLSIRKF